jgi:phage terminase large subunit-like protein
MASDDLRAQLSQLDEIDLRALIWQAEWRKTRRANQTPPEGDWWTFWLINAGRGFGKTRTAAETLGAWAWEQANTRWLVSAATFEDVRATCFEGESGLLNVIPPELIREYNKTTLELYLVNGSLIRGISAEKPGRFRGPQFHGGWLDELAAWQYAQESLDMIMFGMRLGSRPRVIVSTTPRPVPIIMDLVAREGKDVAITHGSTYDNLANLAPTFRAQILQYEGTELGRQEIHAEILNPEESGIVKRKSLRMWPADKPTPALDYIVMSLDTAFTEHTRDKKTGKSDPTACTVWGTFQYEGKTNILLLDAWDAHLGLPDLMKRVLDEMSYTYGPDHEALLKPLFGGRPEPKGRTPDLLLIEDKGSGISLRQMLAREELPAYAYNPGKASKLERLHAVSHIFAHGLVWIPEGRRKNEKTGQYEPTGRFANWTDKAVTELCSFSGEGSTRHDDYVDSISQAIRLLADRNVLRVVNPRSEAANDDEWEPRRVRKNPYAV